MTGQRRGPGTRTQHSRIDGLFGSNAGGKNLVVHAHPNLAEEAVYLSQASGDITRRVGEPRHEAYIARRPLRRGFVSVLVTDDDGVRDDADGVGSGGTPRPRAR